MMTRDQYTSGSAFDWQLATGLSPGVIAGQTCLATPQASGPADRSADLTANFALHVGDDEAAVQARRMQLLAALQPHGVCQLHWLNQTHSTRVQTVADALDQRLHDADALVTREPGAALMIMTADCLPVVLVNADASEVACIHAGWRGLVNGVIEQTVSQMCSSPVFAWLGAAIGPQAFEVGAEVYGAFVQQDAGAADCFVAHPISSTDQKYHADLYALARRRLQALGVTRISGGDQCTFSQPEFYSYRRQPVTGRMATFVCIR